MKELSELKLPEDVRYAEDHEWVKPGSPTRVGISDYAQDQLGDITFVELPEVGRTYDKGEECGTLESTKAVSEVYMPIGGEVVAVNQALEDDPALLNNDPYGDGWLMDVQPSDEGETAALMDKDAYYKMLEGLE
jgi:glycine cleavage system H protein